MLATFGARRLLQRAYATTSNARPFIPPKQLHDVHPNPHYYKPKDNWVPPEEHEQPNEETVAEAPKPQKKGRDRAVPTLQLPNSSSFYTAKSSYYDNMMHLTAVNGQVRHTLRSLHLLPLPAFARENLLPMRPLWKDVHEMNEDFNGELTNSTHSKVIAVLNELYESYRIAVSAGYTELATMISDITAMFESSKKQQAMEAAGRRKRVKIDKYGRSYSMGKRKTSSARVWMIGVKKEAPEAMPASETSLDASLSDAFGATEVVPATTTREPVTVSTVLINNIPLAEFFPQVADRERVVRPLKLAGVLGRFNVFAIVRGGGTTGQSGAIAHGIAKGIVAHDPKQERIFKVGDKLLRRDPRMVERKKPGQPKARKKYAWVRR